MLKVGIVGATGYTGEKLVDILLHHPEVRITYLSAKIEKAEKIDNIFPRFSGKISLVCDNFDLEKATKLCDLLFLAVPHTVSLELTPDLLKANKIVIDLSADYRLKDMEEYKSWYKVAHKDKKNLEIAVYGLPELYRERIKKAKLIANPGCYPTAAILALAPALTAGIIDSKSIIIDAKSGVTGAGRKAAMDFFFSEVNENLKAYKINAHQHIPEIDQEISNLAQKKIQIMFVPHLIPMDRGILETIYVKLSGHKSRKDILKIYQKFYKTEPFVRVYNEGKFPQTKNVLETNCCDIAIEVCEDKKTLIIVAAIDNLMKGAASQAVQNMNIACGFKEDTGLK
ncbi:MAG: N-acetyl-gamma-glutamyl-phosphate reductase [Candidatus Omnitrophica bacterium]|nr:N-acetyl-gamma-glutamyl-phosphate reductase [Candidatus Omnitrophota bacterium]